MGVLTEHVIELNKQQRDQHNWNLRYGILCLGKGTLTKPHQKAEIISSCPNFQDRGNALKLYNGLHNTVNISQISSHLIQTHF